MKSGKKTKNKKRMIKRKRTFFIILTAYIATFVITIGITMSWFGGSVWQNNFIYVGGPVYMDFHDNDGNKTSGAGALVINMPENWVLMYPGMNIDIEASALLVGTSWEHIDDGTTTTVVSTTAILRSRIMVESYSPEGELTELSENITEPIWEQLKEYGEGEVLRGNEGKWIFDSKTSTGQDSYFYYVDDDYDTSTDIDDALLQVSGKEIEDATVTFLDHAVVTLPWRLENEYAGYTLSITVVFQALQAFIPYRTVDIGTPHDVLDRLVVAEDIGTARVLTVKTARPVFEIAMNYGDDDYEDIDIDPSL